MDKNLNMMMVSIITPCYNASAFIEDTIESVLAQTYTNWEMLIVDDCSKDNSAEIIKKYASNDHRIKYFKTDTSSGSPTKPRNIAIEKALGRYIAFLDSDDIWLPKKLEDQIPLLDDEHTAIVYSNYEKISEDGLRNNRIILAPNKVDYDDLLKGNVIGNLTGIYDTEKVGKIFCQHTHHEDYILWLSILKKGYIARNSNKLGALYRVRNNSVSSNKLQVIGWQWNIYRNIEKLNIFSSLYNFIHYSIRAFYKSIK